MILCHQHRFVYVSTPKAGTHTMFRYLSERYGGHRIGAYHRRHVPLGHLDYFVFAVVRSPYSRAVSAWYHLLHREPYRSLWRPTVRRDDFRGFMEWMSRGHWQRPGMRGNVVMCPQDEWIAGINRAPDAILRIENINQEFAQLPFATGPQSIPDDFSYSQVYGDWRDMIDAEMAALVRQWAGSDFARFGYEIDEEKAKVNELC